MKIRLTFSGLFLLGVRAHEAEALLMADPDHVPKLTVNGVDYSQKFTGRNSLLSIQRADGQPNTVERFGVSGWTPTGPIVEQEGKLDFRYLANAAWVAGRSVCFDRLCYTTSFRFNDGLVYAKTLTFGGEALDFVLQNNPKFVRWSQRLAEEMGVEIEVGEKDTALLQLGRESIWLDVSKDTDIIVSDDCEPGDDCPPDINKLLATMVCPKDRYVVVIPDGTPSPRRTNAICSPLGCPENC